MQSVRDGAKERSYSASNDKIKVKIRRRSWS